MNLSIGAAVCLLGGVLHAQQESPAVTTPEDLLPFIERQESAIRFVRGRGVSVGTAELDGVAVRTGEADVTFIRETSPAGRSFLDYSLLVLRSTDGEYYRDRNVYGYDGSTSWNLRRQTMVEGRDAEPIPLLLGQISAKRSPSHNTDDTGWSATLPGFQAQRGRRFSESLRRSESPFRLRSRGAEVVLSCDDQSGKVVDEWTLRPEWAYALVRYERIAVDSRQVEHSISVETAVRLHPDLWYPTKVRHFRAASGQFKNSEKIVEVKDVVAMADQDPAVFRPAFPKGTSVSDSDTQRTFVVTDQNADVRSTQQGIPRWLLWLGVFTAIGGLAAIHWHTRRERNAARTAKASEAAGVVRGLCIAAVCVGAATAQDGAASPWCGDVGIEVSDALRAGDGGVAGRQEVEWPANASVLQFWVSSR